MYIQLRLGNYTQLNTKQYIAWLINLRSFFHVQRKTALSLLCIPRANGAKRRSGRKPGARVTNSARLFTPGKMRTQRSVAKCKVHQ